MSLAFLLDANLSPLTAEYLSSLGYDAKSLLAAGLGRIPDQEVVALAKREDRIIITQDLGFGQIYYFAERGQIGIIILRLRIQTVEMVNRVLGDFLQTGTIEKRGLEKALITLTEASVRIYAETR